MTNMSVTSRREGSTGVVVVAGEFDLNGSDPFARVVSELVDQGAQEVRVDLDEVTFIDSSGLSALVHVRETVEARGRSFRLGHLSASVERVLELSGLRDELHPR